MSTAAAYLRRSVSKDPTKEVSREAQEAACRRMAGSAPLTLYVDWGMSGGTAKRPDYQRLRTDLDAGRVSAIYAYSISRLARSARELLDLLDACKARGVTVTTEAEGTIGGRGAFAKFTTLMLVGVAEMERDLASERTLSAVAARRERGDRLGPAPYGDLPGEDFGAVVDAYRSTRSLQATARLLNASGVPTRQGRPWRESAVRMMLRARAPELLPRERGTRAAATPFLLSGLLRCPHDGTRLAAKRNHGRWASYTCRRAAELPDHPRPFSVSEAAILPAIRAEVSRHILPLSVTLGDAPDLAAERADLVGQRERLALAFARGGLPEDTYTAEDVALAERIDALADREETAVDVPPITDAEWETWAPADLNAYLGATLRRVRLGADLRPLPFTADDWRNPAARGA